MDNLTITLLKESDIQPLTRAFTEAAWFKPYSLFYEYLQDQKLDERLVWIARHNDQMAGYITLKWQSDYPPFLASQIPEIKDLNVLPNFRNNGIGLALLQQAEKEAFLRTYTVGIGVGLYGGPGGGYGAAQRLYIQCGYIPDGCGVSYKYKAAIPGESYALDDDLILCLTKKRT